MDTYYIVLIGVIVVGIFLYLFAFRNKKATPVEKTNAASGSHSLQLQAYERLTLLADRIALSNLISRIPYDGLSARDMQLVLTRTIRDEFDYNITQQIYITPETWNAVKNLKEKNMLIINQVASMLPVTASGLDLNRALLEYTITDDKADQHTLVSEALSYEAKKLL